MNKNQFIKKYGLTEDQFNGSEEIGGLYLEGLTSIPEGFNPTVGGSLDLEGLASIPEGFNPTVGGSLDLEGLASIPEGFNPTVGGNLYLRGLTSIPEGFNPAVGGSLYLRGELSAETKSYQEKVLSWKEGKLLLIDGVLTEVIHQRNEIYKVKVVGQNEESYVVKNGDIYAHGETIQDAQSDLLFKITGSDTSHYKNLKSDHEFTEHEAVVCYRAITGACRQGTKLFLSHSKPEKFTVQIMSEITVGQFGHDQFCKFFNIKIK